MFYNKTYNFVILILITFFSCKKDSNVGNSPSNEFEDFVQETIILDDGGNVIETTIDISHFASSQDCQECHAQQYEEWHKSMHAHSFDDPIFFNMWTHEKPLTSKNYCTQCHAPAAFVSNYNLDQVLTLNDISLLPDPIKDGVSCQFCHNAVNTSRGVETLDNFAAVAEYYLSVDKNVMFGSIQNPEVNNFHESYYSEIYSNSGICLPCHDQSIKGMNIETTFREWDDVFGMGGLESCQSCHMPIKADGTHDHSFVGVDYHDLTQDLNTITTTEEYSKIMELMESSAQLEFYNISTDIVSNNSLNIPIKVTSFTGHKFPSGTTFSREAWIELKVVDAGGNMIYSSGVVDNFENLDYDDEKLLSFTSWLIDSQGNITNNISEVDTYIDNTLNTMGIRLHDYNIFIDDNAQGPLIVYARLRFRPFKPSVLAESNPSLVNNIPIYDISSISQSINILNQ